jgi:hypothetical protein
MAYIISDKIISPTLIPFLFVNTIKHTNTTKIIVVIAGPLLY